MKMGNELTATPPSKSNEFPSNLPLAIHGDCLEILPLVPDNSIDMILCDLPYNIT